MGQLFHSAAMGLQPVNKELVAKDAQRRRSATTWGLLRWAAFVGLRQQRTRKALKPWGDAQRAWLAAPA